MPNEQEKTQETCFEEENRKYFWSVETVFIPKEATFPFPMKHVVVMRQTRESIDNASEHTVNGFQHEESDVGHTQRNVACAVACGRHDEWASCMSLVLCVLHASCSSAFLFFVLALMVCRF